MQAWRPVIDYLVTSDLKYKYIYSPGQLASGGWLSLGKNGHAEDAVEKKRSLILITLVGDRLQQFPLVCMEDNNTSC